MQFTKKLVMFSVVAMLTMGVTVTYTNDWGNSSIAVSIEEAYAKFRSGGGFKSSSRSSMSSFSSRSKSKPVAYKAPTKSYTTPKKAPPKANTAPPPKPPAFAKAGQRATAKQAAAKQAAAYKKPVTPAARTTTLASTNSYNRDRLTNVNRSTYYTERTTYVNRWESNSRVSRDVVILGSPSYGIYDSAFMWHVAFADPYWGYHNYNNPGYLAWKREARELARDNAELRAQLDAHETAMAQVTGDRNANYLPAGIENADVIYAPAFVEATKPPVRICTGRKDGKYAQAALQYKTVVAGGDVQVVFTEGSVQNLQMIATGDCDVAFTQRDAYMGYDDSVNPLQVTRVGALYNEAVHMFCAKDSGVTHLSDLNGRDDIRMWTGNAGSGANVTWNNFKSLNDQLQATTVQKPATDAAFGTTSTDCGIYVGYLNSPFMQTVSKSNNLRMIDVETVPTDTILDPQGKPVYGTYTIAADTYKIQTGWADTGWYEETPTVTVPVDIIAADTWASQGNANSILTEIQNTRQAVVSAL